MNDKKHEYFPILHSQQAYFALEKKSQKFTKPIKKACEYFYKPWGERHWKKVHEKIEQWNDLQ